MQPYADFQPPSCAIMQLNTLSLSTLSILLQSNTPLSQYQTPKRIANSFNQSQISCEIPTLASVTKDLLQRVLSLVDRRRQELELSLWAHQFKVKRSIKRLFKEIIILSVVARTHVRQRSKKKHLKSFASSVQNSHLLKLRDCIGLLDRALARAAARGMFCPCRTHIG